MKSSEVAIIWIQRKAERHNEEKGARGRNERRRARSGIMPWAQREMRLRH